MLRAGKGNAKLAWPFLEALSTLPNEPITANHSLARACWFLQQSRPLSTRAEGPRERAVVGTRWSDCRSRRTVRSGREEGSFLNLAPRSWSGRRRYASTALALKEDGDHSISHHDIHSTSMSSSTLDEELPALHDVPAQYDAPPTTTPNSHPPDNRPTQNRSKRATGTVNAFLLASQSGFPSLPYVLNHWKDVERYPDLNRQKGRIVKRLMRTVRINRVEIELDKALHGKVVHRLLAVMQGVIDKNRQEARTRLGLSSNVPVKRGEMEERQVWQETPSIVQSIAETLCEYDLLDNMSEMLEWYRNNPNNKGTWIDLSGNLSRMIDLKRWPELLRYARQARKRNPQDLQVQTLEMRCLNELGRSSEVLEMYEQAGEAALSDIIFLSEAMRAQFASRRLMDAMKIRERLWGLDWPNGFKAGYCTALTEGIRRAGFLPDIEERLLEREMKVLHDQPRRRLLDVLARCRVDAGSRIRHLLPYYTIGMEDEQAIAVIMQEPETFEWLLRSREIVRDPDILDRLWRGFIESKSQSHARIPAFLLHSYLSALERFGLVEEGFETLHEIVTQDPTGSNPTYELDLSVFQPLLRALSRTQGMEGAERALQLLSKANIRPDRRMALTMVQCIQVNHEILNAEYQQSMTATVEALCALQTTQPRKRKLKGLEVATEEGLQDADKLVLQEVLKIGQGKNKDMGLVNSESPPFSTSDDRYRESLRNNDRIALMSPQDYYHAMTQHGVTIDAQRFTEVMTFFLGASDARNAFEAFNLGRLVGVKPSFGMWVALMWGTMRFEGYNACRRTLVGLKQDGLTPNISAYTTVGAILVRTGRFRQAKEFMDMALKRIDHDLIDTIFISVAFNAKCRAGKQSEAIELFRRFEGNDRFAMDGVLRRSIKRFRDWHKKQNKADAVRLAEVFQQLIVENTIDDTASKGRFLEVRKWLVRVLRQYWLGLPQTLDGPKPFAEETSDKIDERVEKREEL
jgi:tetratricopeptide (TPR) repeat protein